MKHGSNTDEFNFLSVCIRENPYFIGGLYRQNDGSMRRSEK